MSFGLPTNLDFTYILWKQLKLSPDYDTHEFADASALIAASIEPEEGKTFVYLEEPRKILSWKDGDWAHVISRPTKLTSI